ncbi:hypothetical protein ACIBF5_11820 [Micromonospora sp. NPDC050417]
MNAAGIRPRAEVARLGVRSTGPVMTVRPGDAEVSNGEVTHRG